MKYQCGVCNKEIEGDLMIFKEHVEHHIVEEIVKNYPEWAEKDGTCQKCLEFYKKQMNG